MKSEQYEALITRLEAYARKHPAAYRFRVGALAALGYVYILAVLLTVLALLIGTIWLMASSGNGNFVEIKLVIFLLVFAGLILRSLWVQIPPPEGIELRNDEAAGLFAMVGELTKALDAPRFDHILIDGRFNAAAAQIPRLGIFGWQRNYLLFGLPLMSALPPEQFRAVVAHELGHLSGNHGKFAGWIYRVFETWKQLLQSLADKKGKGHWAFVPFFKWYFPVFGAYSFVLRRTNEYEADRAAAQLAGVQTAGDALINVELRGRYLQADFWPTIYKQAERQQMPPASPYGEMSNALSAGLPPDAVVWLQQALAEKTGHEDTHPALSDRLAAFGYRDFTHQGEQSTVDCNGAASQKTVPASQAAVCYLGGALPGVMARLDAQWKQAVGAKWKERHAYAREALDKLQALDAKARDSALSEEEAWQRATWTAEFRTADEALPLFREIHAAHPAEPRVNFALGQLLLADKDESGVALIEKAMASEPQAIPGGCQAIHGFLKDQGRSKEAESYRDRYVRHQETLAQAQEEREGISAADRFLPHGLDHQQEAQLVSQLAARADVHRAYLARKAVKVMPEKPFYVLAIVPCYAWYRMRSTQTNRKIAHEIATSVRFPGRTWVVVLAGDNAKLGRAVKKASGAEIYRWHPHE